MESKIGNEFWRSKGLERRSVDWGSRVSNATIEIIDFGGVNQRELETSGDKSCSLHQVEGTFVPEISWQFSENDGIQGELVWKEEKNTRRTSTESMWTLYDPWQWSYHENKL